MSKIFEFDTRKGSLIDKVSGNVLTNTDVEIKNTEKGRSARFNGNTSKLDHSTTQSYAMNTAFTIEIYLNLFDSETNSRHILADDAVDASSRIYYSAVSNRLIFNDSNNGDCFGSKSLNSYTWYHVMIINDGAGNVNFVVNNIDDIDTITTANLFNFNTIGGIRGEATAVEAFFGDISIVGTYDKALNAQERQNLYNDFLRSSNISSSLTLKQKVQHKVIAQEPDLVLFHNYENGNSLDLTNNSNDGADTAIDYGVDGARLNGLNSLITVADDDSLSFGDGSSDSPFSVEVLNNFADCASSSFIVKRTNTTTNREYEISLASYSGGTYIFFILYDQSANAYIGRRYNYAGGEDLYNDKEIHFVFTYDGSGQSSGINIYVDGQEVDNGTYNSGTYVAMENLGADLLIGNNASTSFLKGSSKYTKIYNKELSHAEVTEKYNKIAKQIVFNEDMINQNADGKVYSAGMILPNDWNVQSGTIKVSEDGTQKWFEQVTDGVTSISNTSAYMTLEFDINKVGTTLGIYIVFISTSFDFPFNGYYLVVTKTGLVALYRRDGNLATNMFSTVNNYISINTKNSIKIIRSPEGVITAYIKGDHFGNSYILIDVSGGSGANPSTADNTYTTSSYMFIDSDIGDKFSNIKISKGVVV